MPGNLAGPWAEEIAVAIAQAGDPRRAVQEKRYLKSNLDHPRSGRRSGPSCARTRA